MTAVQPQFSFACPEDATIDRELEFLYYEGQRYHFLDRRTFDRIELGAQELGEAPDFLRPKVVLGACFRSQKLVRVILPIQVSLLVTDVDSVSASGQRQAVLETGLTLTVPQTVSVGDLVVVDTLTRSFAAIA
ncbi:MAG: hypothetical protein AUJ55_08490 [Proteobacteria bacterium CG1_02_64_396]|nr:MAG: hypothetical protein AUJ55_08490 [Proteobacteria bacterium CG1_02_64_396]